MLVLMLMAAFMSVPVCRARVSFMAPGSACKLPYMQVRVVAFKSVAQLTRAAKEAPAECATAWHANASVHIPSARTCANGRVACTRAPTGTPAATSSYTAMQRTCQRRKATVLRYVHAWHMHMPSAYVTRIGHVHVRSGEAQHCSMRHAHVGCTRGMRKHGHVACACGVARADGMGTWHMHVAWHVPWACAWGVRDVA